MTVDAGSGYTVGNPASAEASITYVVPPPCPPATFTSAPVNSFQTVAPNQLPEPLLVNPRRWGQRSSTSPPSHIPQEFPTAGIRHRHLVGLTSSQATSSSGYGSRTTRRRRPSRSCSVPTRSTSLRAPSTSQSPSTTDPSTVVWNRAAARPSSSTSTSSQPVPESHRSPGRRHTPRNSDPRINRWICGCSAARRCRFPSRALRWCHHAKTQPHQRCRHTRCDHAHCGSCWDAPQ